MKIGPFAINFRRLGLLVVVGLVLVLVMNFNTRLDELGRIQNQVATVRVQATGIMSTQEALLTQVALATSPAAVATYARSEAHMGQPDDQVIIVKPVPGATPPPSPTPIPAINVLTPLDVWTLLIFGK
jgi:cell division protein FtsB